MRALAAELGVECTIDPTITPKMDGDTSILGLRISEPQLLRVYMDKSLLPDPATEPPPPTDEEMLDARPCSAGHTACYISPYGDVFPCVQFPLPTGNLRQQSFTRHVAPFAADGGGPRHPDARSADLLDVQLHDHLHALPGARLHGRQHARALVGGLRKIPDPRRGCGDDRGPMRQDSGRDNQ